MKPPSTPDTSSSRHTTRSDVSPAFAAAIASVNASSKSFLSDLPSKLPSPIIPPETFSIFTLPPPYLKSQDRAWKRSVPPRGSGWVDDQHAIATHPLPRGGTDLFQE